MSCQPNCAVCAQLRAVSLQIVAQQGIDTLTHEAVAAESRLSPESVAAHYPELASCLCDGYDEEASDLIRTVVAGYQAGTDWVSGFERSRADLLEWLSAHPAGARLFFVEAMRGNRELRLRRDLTRRKIVEFLTGEYARSANGDGVPALQIELLIAASFQVISRAMCNGGTSGLPERLAEIDGFLVPAHA